MKKAGLLLLDSAPLNTDELEKFFTTRARVAPPSGRMLRTGTVSLLQYRENFLKRLTDPLN